MLNSDEGDFEILVKSGMLEFDALTGQFIISGNEWKGNIFNRRFNFLY